MNSLSRNIRLWFKFWDFEFSCQVPQSVFYILHSSSTDHTLDKKHLLRDRNKRVKQTTEKRKKNSLGPLVHLLTFQNHSAMPFM